MLKKSKKKLKRFLKKIKKPYHPLKLNIKDTFISYFFYFSNFRKKIIFINNFSFHYLTFTSLTFLNGHI